MFRHACMNRAYALAWNDALGAWVPVPEHTRRCGKRSVGGGGTAVAAAVLLLFGTSGAQAAPADPHVGLATQQVGSATMPTGGQVVAGQARIGQTGNVTTVLQGSARAVIDWQTFSVGKDGTVDFVQPSTSAVALNRVVGQDPSQIFGAINANGQVFIVNPNGVLFAPGAQVSAAGILASTRGIGDADFMAGRLGFAGSSAAGVVNQGHLGAQPGGYVVLVGAQVVNSGSIAAPLGDVRLAAADQVTLKVDGAGLVAFTVTNGTLDGLAANHGLIQADGGRIFLTADALDQLSRAVVNNDGVIEARTVGEHDGKVVLRGDMNVGQVSVGGTLDASAPEGGDGGFIETSAAHVHASGPHTVTTAAAHGKSGTWLIDPADFTIAASGGDTTGTQLGTDLSGGNVTIQSTSGTVNTSGVGDINVNDTVTWTANTLTLNAQRNINVNADLIGSSSAQLALQFGQGAIAAGNAATYSLNNGKGIYLSAGNNLTTQLGSDGVVKSFYVITTLGSEGSTTGTDLQGINGALSGNFAMGNDIGAGPAATWGSNAGFTPIGSTATPFTGNFEGLGHKVSGLPIDRPTSDDVGLFGSIAAGSTVSNLYMFLPIIVGQNNVGAVVGNNLGSLNHVTGFNGVVTGATNVGGFVGVSSGSVADSSSPVSVTGVTATGGLIGANSGAVVNSTSTYAVVATGDAAGGLIGDNSAPLGNLTSSASVSGGTSMVGGLVGHSSATVSSSTATGAVYSSGSQVGGLIGSTSADVVNSSASNGVHGASAVGGLIGQTAATSTVTGASATGRVDGTGNQVGGLIGFNQGAVSGGSVTLTGSAEVTGLGKVGGLIGENSGPVLNSTASTSVTATADDVGGLIGHNDAGASVTNSSAIGSVAGADVNGGLVGYNDRANITSSHASVAIDPVNVGGGLVGWSIGSAIADSYATGTVGGEGAVMGGLVGKSTNYSPSLTSSITNSYATGAVTGTGGIGMVGGLVGYAEGSISGSYASGAVTNTGATSTGGLVGESQASIVNSHATTGLVHGAGNVGGLVGLLDPGAGISAGSYASGAVVGTSIVGGLVGRNTGGSIANATASGTVTNTGTSTGGLIGLNEDNGVTNVASITSTTASGAVNGKAETGGLIGTNSSLLTSQSASNTVSGTNDVGGLVGRTSVDISNSSASGTVAGANQVGGLVGFQSAGSLSAAYATGAVVATANAAGGLVGESAGAVVGSHAGTGSVTGINAVGGLVGQMDTGASVSGGSYAGGAVHSTSQAGGLVGLKSAGTITDATASGTVQGHTVLGGLVGENTGDIATSSTATTSTVTATTTTSSDSIGGLIGANHASTIHNVVANGNVSGHSGVGGLIGHNTGGVVSDSTANGSVTSAGVNAGYVGGLIGYQDVTLLERVTATGAVIGGSAGNVGGLVGGGTGPIDQGTVAATATVTTTGGNVGGLIGYSSGNITNSTVAGTSTVAGGTNVGGFIGYGAGGSVDHAGTTRAVTSGYYVGGFIGVNHTSAITFSSATGAVNGIAATGGFVGVDYGPISDSTASGAVHGTSDNTGGFAGYVDVASPLTRVTASGAVIGVQGTGGLAGESKSAVTDSTAAGNVTGTSNVGGLVGKTTDATVVITNSGATGNVSGTTGVGGLVGNNISSIVHSTASGAVSGATKVGGLVGYNSATTASIALSTASGAATATGPIVGGLVGDNLASSITGSTASGAVVGTVNVGGLVGANEPNAAIGSSSASGNVTGLTYVGGFVGSTQVGVLSGDTASGNVTAASGATLFTSQCLGGFAGYDQGTLTSVTATGNVNATGSYDVGGLVGLILGNNARTLGASSATGSVVGANNVGGIAGSVEIGAIVSNIQAGSGTVTGVTTVGGFVGNISSGSVTGSSSARTVAGHNIVGGFVGNVTTTGVTPGVTSSSASGAVSASNGDVGGFVGVVRGTLSGDPVNGVFATGSVTSAGSDVGGFAGRNNGTIQQVSASNAVTATNLAQNVGGLVGLNASISGESGRSGGIVQQSRALNAVIADGDNVGGLIGSSTSGSVVTTSYAAGSATGRDAVGGLIGNDAGTTSIAYAAASVTGRNNVGGLTGLQPAGASATNVYASGAVSGIDAVGGLIGSAAGSATYSYANGAVTGTTRVGGLTGIATGATVAHSFYDTNATGQAHSSSDYASVGETATAVSTAQLDSAATFVGWNLTASGTHDRTWRSYEGSAAPLLTYWLTPLTITANGGDSSRIYDGTVHTTTVAPVVYTETLTAGHLLGTPSYTTGKNVGVYTALGGQYSDQQGYDIAYVNNGSLTITPALLTVSLVGVTKTYDGSTAAALLGGNFSVAGFAPGEGADLSATTGVYDSKDVRSASSVSTSLTPGSYAAYAGTLLGNYVLATSATGSATITPRPLGVAAVASDKVYDGSAAAVASLAVAPGGVIGSDDVSVAGTARFADKNAGVGKTVTVGLALGGADASNYALATPTAVATATITPKTVSVGATGVDRVYDGTTVDAALLAATGVIAGDNVGFAGTSTFADKNVGANKAVTVTGIASTGVDAANYVAENTSATTTASITPKTITVDATGIGKVYDATVTGNANLASAGVVAGDTVEFSGSAAYADKNAGVGKALTVTGITKSGDDAGNYVLSGSTAATTATITRKAVSLVATGTDKVYDGTVDDAVALSAAAGDVLAGDTVTFAGTGRLADRNVGVGKAVSVSGITAGGVDGGNYSVDAEATTRATVSRRDLTVTLTGATVKIGDTTLGATLRPDNYAVGNIATGDHIAVTQTHGTFADAVAGTHKTVTTQLAASDYLPDAATLLDNYNLVLGSLSGPIGTIVTVPPAALLSALVSLPNNPSGASQLVPDTMALAFQADATTTGTTTKADLLAPATASIVSGNTRDNLLFRRAFSIGDGGIRLPEGVRGSDKDASQ